MNTYFPIVIETEPNGAVGAYVPGLPVFAAANTRPKAERAIRETLAAYLKAHPESVPTSEVRVARVSSTSRSGVHIVGVSTLLGASRRKAATRAKNDRPGGRSRRVASPTRS